MSNQTDANTNDIDIPVNELRYNSSILSYEDMFSLLHTFYTNRKKITEVLGTESVSILMRIIAAVQAGEQMNIISATQESTLATATKDETIKAKTALDFGVFLQRKTPAAINVEIQNLSLNSIKIPKFSSFTINKTKLFNRDEIVAIPAETLTTTLYEGERVEESFVFSGANYETLFLTKVKDYSISTDDIYVEVTDNLSTDIYKCIKEPLFVTGSNNVKAVQQITTQTGEVMIEFGDGVYGKKPSQGSLVKVVYIKTKGSNGNIVVTENSKIEYQNDLDISIKNTSSLLNGADELSAEYYRHFAPALRSSTVIGGAIDYNQLKAWALSFRNVVDCQLLGQRDTFPNNLRYLNVIQASVLTTSGILKPQEWDQFVVHMKKRSNMEFSRVDPEGIDIDINIEVYISADIYSETTRNKITSAFQEYFTPKINYIGQNFYISDVGKILRTVLGSEELKRYNVIFPTENTSIKATQYLKLRNFTLRLISI